MRLLTTIKEKAGPIMVSNIAQEWIDEGKALGLLQGMAEGMAQGVAEGMAQGEARLLTRQLTRRFGTLPAEVTARMEDADTEALETWGERLLDARTLDEVFAPDKSSLS
jgi:flagellar biosynthesis/type III secretory pathway protein FliH